MWIEIGILWVCLYTPTIVKKLEKTSILYNTDFRNRVYDFNIGFFIFYFITYYFF